MLSTDNDLGMNLHTYLDTYFTDLKGELDQHLNDQMINDFNPKVRGLEHHHIQTILNYITDFQREHSAGFDVIDEVIDKSSQRLIDYLNFVINNIEEQQMFEYNDAEACNDRHTMKNIIEVIDTETSQYKTTITSINKVRAMYQLNK